MSRYDWPPNSGRKGRDDDPAARMAFNARRRAEFDPEGALRVSRTPHQPAQDPGGAPRPFAPASGRHHLWQPLGPVTVLGCKADFHALDSQRVSGRVNAICVHPDGQRIYAGSANGGVWYSKDGGANWVSVGGLASTNTADILQPAHGNACGALLVDWSSFEGEDIIYVGTGGYTDWGTPTGQPGESVGGIGILVGTVNSGSWEREAPNLVNNSVYSIVREPGGNIWIAATRKGLFERPAVAGVERNWERPTSKPFHQLEADCTDLLWTPGDALRPARLWVWVRDDDENTGLWVRNAVGGNFAKVAVDVLSPFEYTPGRACLAASTPATQVWVLNDRGEKLLPALFRVTNPVTGPSSPTAHGVVGVPDILHDHGSYAIAIAVDPANADRVVLAGTFLKKFFTQDGAPVEQFFTQDGAPVKDASIVVADVALDPGPAGWLTYGLPPTPCTMIGVGVHPDVHALAYSNGGASLWAGCDGGIFRSDLPTRPAGFYARNNGLSISETNYIAAHPRCEGHIIAGLQDNGVVMRLSSGVWTQQFWSDGGGVVMNAASPDQWLAQTKRGIWNRFPPGGTGPLQRGNKFYKEESDGAAFYSMPASISHMRISPHQATSFSQTLVGTYRLWYSEDFGVTWVTLPNGKDPLPGDPDIDSIHLPITVCRWQSPEVAWVLCEQRLTRYARTPGSDNAVGPGTWTSAPVMPPGFVPPGNARPPSLLDSSVWTDIAVNLDLPPGLDAWPAQHGTLGAVYIGTIGNADNAGVDTLWWFDGTDKWYPTGLRSNPNGVPAPVTAIVCNPASPAEVWVGTTVGVWHGVRTDHGAASPTWDWEQKVNGLPEAAVEDLALFSDGGLVLLRAAIASRGVWELRLDIADVQDLTYVRAHDDDLRYRPRAVEKQRDLKTDRSWHGSPDVRPRVAPASVPAPTSLWRWWRGTSDEKLRRFQAAMKSHTGDPRIVANGVWDAYFSEVLRDHGAPSLPDPVLSLVSLDEPYWNLHMQPPHATAEPWGAGVPSEADLYELAPALTEGELKETSCSLPPSPSKVDIVVHHRGLGSIDGANVRVTLLKWIDPTIMHAAKWEDYTTWFSGDVPWTDAVNDVLNLGSTTKAFAAGWSFVGTTNATRWRTLNGQTLDPMHSGVATFDLDLSQRKKDSVVLVVAIIRAGTTPIALAPAKLQDLAMTSPNVAVRSIHVT